MNTFLEKSIIMLVESYINCRLSVYLFILRTSAFLVEMENTELRIATSVMIQGWKLPCKQITLHPLFSNNYNYV